MQWGALLSGYSLLGKQERVTCRRAIPANHGLRTADNELSGGAKCDDERPDPSMDLTPAWTGVWYQDESERPSTEGGGGCCDAQACALDLRGGEIRETV